jgi:integrase/recombinase XerD
MRASAALVEPIHQRDAALPANVTRALLVADGLVALWVLLDAWQDHMRARGLSDETRDQYESYLLRGLRRGRITPETATTRDLETLIASVPPKGSNRAAYVGAFKSFFRFCLRERLRSDDPAAELRTKPPKYPPPDYFEPDEARRIVEAACLRRNPRRSPTLRLLFETGARIGSIAAIEPQDVQGSPPARIRLRVTKGDRPYSVVLTPSASKAVGELLELMGREQRTLVGVHKVTVGNWFRDAARDAGFPEGRVHAHLARHTAGTLMYRRTKDLILVKDFLGHADTSQVHRYARVNDEEMTAATAEPLTG